MKIKLKWNLESKMGKKDLADKALIVVGVLAVVYMVFIVVYKMIASEPLLDRGIGQSSGQVGNVRMNTGLIYKTNEVKIIYGIDNTVEYSFVDHKIAKCLNENIGKRINIKYDSYFGVPFSMGSTKLIISHCEKEN